MLLCDCCVANSVCLSCLRDHSGKALPREEVESPGFQFLCGESCERVAHGMREATGVPRRVPGANDYSAELVRYSENFRSEFLGASLLRCRPAAPSASNSFSLVSTTVACVAGSQQVVGKVVDMFRKAFGESNTYHTARLRSPTPALAPPRPCPSCAPTAAPQAPASTPMAATSLSSSARERPPRPLPSAALRRWRRTAAMRTATPSPATAVRSRRRQPHPTPCTAVLLLPLPARSPASFTSMS